MPGAPKIAVTRKRVHHRFMLLVIVLIVLAILFGIGGLVLTGLKWLLIIGLIFLIAGAVAGFLGRGKTRV